MSEVLKQFEAELENKNFKGYWQNIQGDVYREPVPSFEPCHWKGKDLSPPWKKPAMWSAWTYLPARNPDVESVAQERHLAHPGFESSAAQARRGCASHRHVAGAIRFILKGHGTRLIVEGESFEIGEGDFVTTPSWTWHDHENHGGETMMWLDGLDSPWSDYWKPIFMSPIRPKQTVTKPDGYTLATVGACGPPGRSRIQSSHPPFATNGRIPSEL